jgi:hypothetical protein
MSHPTLSSVKAALYATPSERSRAAGYRMASATSMRNTIRDRRSEPQSGGDVRYLASGTGTGLLLSR